MQHADTLSEMQSFLRRTIEESSFSLTRIALSDQSSWVTDHGYLAHRTHGFFYVAGLQRAHSDEEHLILYQPQSAITGLLFCRHAGTIYTLLQARIEPGNTGIGQYGPTIQSTPANFLKLHGGKQTACLEYFYQLSAAANPIGVSMQLDLGGRYFQKSKTHQHVEVNEMFEPDGAMIWASIDALKASLGLPNFLNADLRSLISVFDWDRLLFGTSVAAGQGIAARVLDRIAAAPVGAPDWMLCPISTLRDWALTDQGVEDRTGRGISVEMFHTRCGSREVSAWTQPLLSATDVGRVRLLCRRRHGVAEFLVSITREIGISGPAAIGPSEVVYPGSPLPEPNSQLGSSRVLASFRQSDEGGRFFQHESDYEILEIDQDIPIGDDQLWITAADLRTLLGTSNLVNFQLRCIASCLFEWLNPRTAALDHPRLGP